MKLYREEIRIERGNRQITIWFQRNLDAGGYTVCVIDGDTRVVDLQTKRVELFRLVRKEILDRYLL